jgi:small subunit ribosomal protein S16
MAVHIRLARHGSKNRPFYHLIASDHKMRRDGGKFIEKLGVYDPGKEPSLVEFKEDRVQYWYGKGAQLSETVAKLLKAKNIKVERQKTSTKPA